MEVPVAIATGADLVSVVVAEEICTSTIEEPAQTATSPRSAQSPREALSVSLKTVVTIGARAGERVGLLAHMATAIATQGLSIAEATYGVIKRVLFHCKIKRIH